MADTKKANPPGTRPAAGGTARGRAAKRTAAAVRGQADRADEAGRRGGEAVRKTVETAADAPRRAGETAAQGAGAVVEAVRGGAAEAGGAQKTEETGRNLAGMMEEATAGMRSLMASPGSGPSGLQDAQQAVSRLLESVVATNMRFADELLRRTGPSAVAELQGRFLREYFDALAQGGAMLLRAARQTAESSLRPLERQTPERGAGGKAAGRVADVMSRDVEVAGPDDTAQQAARAMAERDTGVLPVGENGRLVGMVTDRDLAVRVLAAGKDPAKTKLREVMSGEPRYLYEDESVERAAVAMAEHQVRRMPVLDRGKRLVGMLSLGDLAGGGKDGRGAADQALAGVARPGGQHTQGAPPPER